MPAKAGIQPAYVSLTTNGLGPSLRWGDGFWLQDDGLEKMEVLFLVFKRLELIANLLGPFEVVRHLT
jgi:hypothetical protein